MTGLEVQKERRVAAGCNHSPRVLFTLYPLVDEEISAVQQCDPILAIENIGRPTVWIEYFRRAGQTFNLRRAAPAVVTVADAHEDGST